MSSSSTVTDRGSLEGMGGFAFGVGVSVAVITLIIIITLASYYCTRVHQDANHSFHTAQNSFTTVLEFEDHTMVNLDNINIGLDEATLESYPKVVYSQVKTMHKHKGDQLSVSSCCSICLADYKDTDVLRLLPDCGHLFHQKCVDSWLRVNPTCPMCRHSPLPTPLAEVTPLTGLRVV